MITGAIVSSPTTIFLVVLGIMLIVPLICKRLRVPNVIGLILAGLAVGPHGFGILERDMSFEVFGQVGLLYLMFLAGLEIDRYHLKQNLRAGIAFGALTFAVPLGVGIAVALCALQMSLPASMLIASMFAAHTLLAYPIAARLGLINSRPVIIAVAGTIFAVLGSLIVLAAVVKGHAAGGFSLPSLIWLGAIIVGFSLAVWLVYPRLARWFFRTHSDGIEQFIFVLAMMLLCAVAARFIGIESVFGAFFAGLAFNRYVPRRSPLMSRIEFVGNAIFIPYFLIAVGMLIDVRVILTGWTTLWVAAVMSAGAMLSKWLAAFAAQKLFGLSGAGRSVMYQLTNAHTAVALAVVAIGHSLGLFDAVVINATVLMILVTCSVSSIGMQRAARRLKLRLLNRDGAATPDAMASSTGRLHRGSALISLNNPATAARLVELAMLMRGRSSKDTVALTVRTDNSPSTLQAAREALDKAERTAAASTLPLKPVERFDHNVVSGVINTMAERDISELILGLHARSAMPLDSFLGPKTMQIIDSTNKMVVVSRLYTPLNTLRRIVVDMPPKAEFETGFHRTVDALASLAAGLGCIVDWHATPSTLAVIRALIDAGGYGIDCEWHETSSSEEFILLSNVLADDDLLVAVTSRRAAVSFTPDLDNRPAILQRYFNRFNLMLIYPEQFGDEPYTASMAHSLATDFTASPPSLLRRLRAFVTAR